MAKKKKEGGGSSWFTAVKKAFRSPTKLNDTVGKQDQQLDQQDQDNKKREKRRWIFRKASHTDQQHPTKDEQKHIIVTSKRQISRPSADDDVHPTQAQPQQGQALTVAAATAAAAKAAAATAEAAAEIARLMRPHAALVDTQYHYAAVIIQAAFRAYLARRALEALRGIVKLQAFIRGDSVRRRTKIALRNIQALIQMQSQMKKDQRATWISQDKTRKSMFAETNNLWDKHMHDIRQRKSMSRERTNHPVDEWDEFPYVDNGSMLQTRKEAALRREKALAFALSQQIWGFDRARDNKDLDERTEWLNRWMATKQWENTATTTATNSTDRVRDSTSTPRTMAAVAAYRQSPKRQNTPQIVSRHSLSHHRPSTPSSIQTKPLMVRSASPRCSTNSRRSTSAATTPCLNSRYSYNKSNNNSSSNSTTPNYMASTQSAIAKTRSVSTPKQRPATPSRERNGAVRKRLSFPMRDPAYTDSSSFSQSLRSPSFRSICPAIERGNYHSYYPDSACGEISPASTTHVRRWLG